MDPPDDPPDDSTDRLNALSLSPEIGGEVDYALWSRGTRQMTRMIGFAAPGVYASQLLHRIA